MGPGEKGWEWVEELLQHPKPFTNRSHIKNVIEISKATESIRWSTVYGVKHSFTLVDLHNAYHENNVGFFTDLVPGYILVDGIPVYIPVLTDRVWRDGVTQLLFVSKHYRAYANLAETNEKFAVTGIRLDLEKSLNNIIAHSIRTLFKSNGGKNKRSLLQRAFGFRFPVEMAEITFNPWLRYEGFVAGDSQYRRARRYWRSQGWKLGGLGIRGNKIVVPWDSILEPGTQSLCFRFPTLTGSSFHGVWVVGKRPKPCCDFMIGTGFYGNGQDFDGDQIFVSTHPVARRIGAKLNSHHPMMKYIPSPPKPIRESYILPVEMIKRTAPEERLGNLVAQRATKSHTGLITYHVEVLLEAFRSYFRKKVIVMTWEEWKNKGDLLAYQVEQEKRQDIWLRLRELMREMIQAVIGAKHGTGGIDLYQEFHNYMFGPWPLGSEIPEFPRVILDKYPGKFDDLIPMLDRLPKPLIMDPDRTYTTKSGEERPVQPALPSPMMYRRYRHGLIDEMGIVGPPWEQRKVTLRELMGLPVQGKPGIIGWDGSISSTYYPHIAKRFLSLPDRPRVVHHPSMMFDLKTEVELGMMVLLRLASQQDKVKRGEIRLVPREEV